MKKIIILVIILQISFFIVGCGGAYYTDDRYFSYQESPGWDKDWWNGRLISKQCKDISVWSVPVMIESVKTSYAFFSIPVIPSNQIISEYNIDQPIVLEFVYKGNVGDCDNKDFTIKINNSTEHFQPASSETVFHSIDENETFCRYWFNKKFSSTNKIDIYFTDRKFGCNTLPLRFKDTQRSNYNVRPF